MTLLKTVSLAHNLHALAFCPTSASGEHRLLCSTADNSLLKIQIPPATAGAGIEVSHSCTQVVGAHRDVCETLEVSVNGQYVATGGNDHMVKVWPLGELCDSPRKQSASKSQTFVGHPDHVTKLRFSPDGANLISVGGGDAIFVWEFCGGTGVDEAAVVDESVRQADLERSTQLAELLQNERQARDVIPTPAQILETTTSAEGAAKLPLASRNLPAELLLPVAVAELKERFKNLDMGEGADTDTGCGMEHLAACEAQCGSVQVAAASLGAEPQDDQPRKRCIPRRVFADEGRAAHAGPANTQGESFIAGTVDVGAPQLKGKRVADVPGLTTDGWTAVEGGGTAAGGLATKCAEGLQLLQLIGFNTHAHDHVLWQQREGRLIYCSGDTLIVDPLQTDAETAYASGR